MTLPEVCPRDGVSQCKKADCHLYVIDWRSGDEQCIIGYGSTHKQMSRSAPVVDTYAERTRIKREIRRDCPVEEAPAEPSQPRRETRIPDAGPEKPETPEKTPLQEAKTPAYEEPENDPFNEKVVSSDKNTTLIESGESRDESQPERKKKKSIDDVMNLDLPENYEEEFWK
ncbi:hypothetical protein HWN40_00555 [Methanolobus zinderi]|uniref:Uncharacterized protein n=1 Tax=Methanolobus zinderi TaxID=536044 RepID=A0A7D5E552_9EURY|nr:hypothetical protein [Methanolobus zinderi]QLC48872.1 hypothetical protein HWN40_00555 [Methanolobus zinderi]